MTCVAPSASSHTSWRTCSDAITGSVGWNSLVHVSGGGTLFTGLFSAVYVSRAEQACDAWVVRTLPNGRRHYAEALIDSAQAASMPMPVGLMPGMGTTERKTLERRLTMIMKDRVPARLPICGLATTVLIACLLVPGWSRPLVDPDAGDATATAGPAWPSATTPGELERPQRPAKPAKPRSQPSHQAAEPGTPVSEPWRDTATQWRVKVSHKVEPLPRDTRKLVVHTEAGNIEVVRGEGKALAIEAFVSADKARCAQG